MGRNVQWPQIPRSHHRWQLDLECTRGHHKKANGSLAFLRRNLASCPRDIKTKSYQALVRPILEYPSTSWDPYTKSNIQQLEGVQRRAARFVTGDYRTTSSPSQMIAALGWEPLYQQRANFKLVMVYCITYRLIYIPAPLYQHWALEAILCATWFPTARQMYTRIHFHHQQSGYGTSSRRLLRLLQPLMTSRWGWPARINYVQTMFIPLLTCTLFEPHDHLVHSSPQCDNASEKAMHNIGRRRYLHPTAIFSFSRIGGDPSRAIAQLHITVYTRNTI